MRRALFLATTATIIAASGCSAASQTVTTTPNAAKSTAAASAAGSSAAAKSAKVGDSITLAGFKSEKIDVTLVKVFNNATGADEYTTPDAGKQFVAVEFRIAAETGSAAYSDSPDNCVTLKDSAGQQYTSDLSDVKEGQSFGSVNITPGDSVLGVVVFQVPTGTTLSKVQYTIDSGMGDSTGQWNL